MSDRREDSNALVSQCDTQCACPSHPVPIGAIQTSLKSAGYIGDQNQRPADSAPQLQPTDVAPGSGPFAARRSIAKCVFESKTPPREPVPKRNSGPVCIQSKRIIEPVFALIVKPPLVAVLGL